MRVILSFDTEDFTDPVSNDVLLRACRILNERGVRACFGLVGEKARFIRDTGRVDVVEALSAHEIGYHSDNHFLFQDHEHPAGFASRIVEECDWDEAVDWLVATEARGLADIEALFGQRPTVHQRTCGDSAVQVLSAYHRLGLKTYAYGLSIDERSRHLVRYGNMLCISLPLIPEETTHAGETPARLDELSASGADLVNVRFHPCRFLCDEWWDGPHNYMEVADPPMRPPYAPTPHVSAAETDRRLANFAAAVDHVQAHPGMSFTTYGHVTEETPADPLFLTRAQVEEVARILTERLSFVCMGSVRLSLAEAFAAVSRALHCPEAQVIPFRHPLGPVGLPEGAQAQEEVAADEIRDACGAVEDALALTDRVPSLIHVAGRPMAPAPFLRAAARILTGSPTACVAQGPAFPEGFDEKLRRWDQISHDLVAFFPRRGRPVPNTKLAIKLQYWSYRPVELQAT